MSRSRVDKAGRQTLQRQLHEAEHHLREQREQAIVLLRTLGQFMVVATVNGALLDPALWCEFTGLALDAAQGQGWLDAIHPHDRDSVRRAIDFPAADTRVSEPVSEMECRVRRHDGVYRRCVLGVAPLRDATGAPLQWLIACSDRTDQTHLRMRGRRPIENPPAEHRPAENARTLASQLVVALEAMSGGQLPHEASTDVKLIALLRERAQLTHDHEQARIEALALAAANQRMDEFLAVATHDLRSPIAGSKGYVQLALRRIAELVPRHRDPEASYLTGAARHSLERAEQSLKRLARLADRLLDVGRIKSGKLQLSPQRADLIAIVREVVEDLQQATPERTIHLTAPADQRIPIVADADRIGQVVTNFLTNAQRYSPVDRPITVTVERARGHARVSVHDDGQGIPTAQQKLIWRRFEQAQEQPRKEPEQQSDHESGLGLGLYIAKAIVDGHHGRIGVMSRPSHGATFWFTLPVVTPQE